MEEPRLDFEAIFADVACGNADALKFLRVFLCWVHLIDDFVDGDKPAWEPDDVVRTSLDAFLTFGFNPFWQQHKAALLPLVMSGTRAWLDSNQWAGHENFRDRASADVLKSQYQEVLWFVAKLCGGWEHYAKVTAKWRKYHYELNDAEALTERQPLKVPKKEKPHHPPGKGDPKLVEQLTEMLRGDAAGVQFLVTYMRWAHWIDDIVDGDRAWDAEAVARVNLEAVVVFSENAFFLRHRERLAPLIVQAWRAFGDSIQWERRADVKDRRAADVLKSNYHEVYWHSAYLAATEKGEDGWAHLTAMTKKFRVFDYDCED
jgi:hypothetical protein